MYKVLFVYDDGSEDELFVASLDEAMEYENDPDFAGIETA